MNRERLLAAARAVREGRPEDFDMSYYANSCGTPACVLGHYAARQDLQQVLALTCREDWFRPRPTYATNGDRAFYDDDAMLEHFGLSRREAFELFDEGGCGNAKTPEEAARYIEAFVARKEA